MNCDRCSITNFNNIKSSKHTCDTCEFNLCNKCYILHNKNSECFAEKQNGLCYVCLKQGHCKTGVYDYGVQKFICIYHI
jgi:hypothetical protein